MKTIVFNDDNLTIDDIEDNLIKARAIMLNDNKEVLLSKCNDFLFPGGKVEDGENIIDGLVREVKEKTGIELDINSIYPFLFVEQLIKDYPRRGSNTDLRNRRNATYYYLILTNEDVHKDKMQLVENEKLGNFHTFRIKLDKIEPLLDESITDSRRGKCFTRELLAVTQELKKHLE